MTDAIVARGLTRRFGDFTAVDRVDFAVAESEIFGFLGPNGAGKTTTIKMLTGLLPPSDGEARVAGLDVGTQARGVQRVIGYMSQRFSLYPDLRVAENIELFGGLYGVEGERLERRSRWVLRMAGLEGRERQLTAELPLGWKQRLALGCAILHEPPILFLDEPTSGVDPLARRRFWDLIDGLAAAGTTVLVSTHYMEEAEYCHRLAVMNRGRLVALDTPTALRAAMPDPLFEVAVAEAAPAVETLRRAAGVREAAMFGRSVHVTMESASGAEERIRLALAGSGVDAGSIAAVEPSLEDVFVALVRREGGAPAG